MKAAVIYRSKSGYTRQYAQWIAEALEADLFEASKADWKKIAGYDLIVYGGGLYAVGINGLKRALRKLEPIENAKLIVFATGASPNRPKALEEVQNKNFTKEQQRHIPFYYFRGGFDFNRLSKVDRVLMRMLKWKLKSKKELSSDDRGMLMAYDTPVSFVSRERITGLVTSIIIRQ